ncbi:MAG: hypothetical protein DRQ35_01810 [Gammaproteobacteria bacterium]|nr:MAG: hypothetical protein DRQ35_01810 [Gammaproteobacteria bacterium]
MAEAQLQEPEDILNLPDDQLPEYPPEAVVEAPEETNDDDDNTEDKNDEHNEAESPESDEPGEEEDDGTTDEGEDDSESGEGEDLEEPGEDSEQGSESSEEGEQEEGNEEKVVTKPKSQAKGNKNTTETDVVALSPEQQLKQLFAPFKANGRDMQISSVDDAMTLMKMGANYNKKMQGLKPNLRLMKMLENNKLLDEEKLSFLIDLQNKNPQAIAKLVKDSGFDAIDHDEDNTDYTPGTYTVNENEVNLDMVLDEIKDTPTFQKTIDVISKKWDADSRKLVQNDPSIIRKINEQMESGLYDQLMNIVENEKALGRLTEMSDLQAYKHVGDSLQAQGAFAPQPQANGKKTTQKKPQDPKLKNRKKAAANTRSKPGKKQMGIDPLNLSDEDFAKLDPALM